MSGPQHNAADTEELRRFKRLITIRNAADIDREISRLREMSMYEVNLYDPHHRATIINSFVFTTEDAAKEAVQHARKICGEI